MDNNIVTNPSDTAAYSLARRCNRLPQSEAFCNLIDVTPSGLIVNFQPQ